MNKYFLTDGKKNYGPYTLEELRTKNITRETMVWYEGMTDWQPAGTLPELSELFAHTPPSAPFAAAGSTPTLPVNPQIPPKTWLVESILAMLFCCLPFGIVGIVNASKVESRFYAGDNEGAQRYSNDAKKWTMVSFWCGLAGIVLYIILLLIGVAAGFSGSSF